MKEDVVGGEVGNDEGTDRERIEQRLSDARTSRRIRVDAVAREPARMGRWGAARAFGVVRGSNREIHLPSCCREGNRHRLGGGIDGGSIWHHLESFRRRAGSSSTVGNRHLFRKCDLLAFSSECQR